MERGYNNMQRGGIELNLLCIGELQAGKSSFLAHYTGSENTDEHYKIFAKHEDHNTTVFLHEIQEKEGMEVYLKYPYDGILFFVNVLSFHNTASVIMENLVLFSQHSGINVFKIPIMAVLMAQKIDHQYENIEKADKNRFIEEVSGVLSEKQIIYVESDNSFRVQLSKYFQKLIKEDKQEDSIGIKQSIFAQWYMRGLCFFFSVDSIKLHLMRAYQEAKYSSIILKLLSRKMKKKHM